MPDCFADSDKTAEGKQKCVYVVGDSFILCNCIEQLLHLNNTMQ